MNVFRKDYYGYPRFFFEKCSPEKAEAWVFKNGTGYNHYVGDFCINVADEYKKYYIPVRMKRIFYAFSGFWKSVNS